ncbi:N-acetyltransferase family protein [Methylobacterium terricola]|uniref:N-acetyltransferase family protein n=1 Tax=Methylobacterium terricola TaxID=2583531 RepID=A0A5C4LG04_9HYPH|nr:GNAT family N-acetyltransferase [Methylobacterium terricola]TNC12051.1 N-acetyltransferase family protein [Methylobacterium terricola]
MAEDDGVTLRACAEADLPAVTAIYAHAVATGRASFELDPPDLAEMGRRRAALVDGGYPYLVAERAGAVVAYAYAGAYRPRPAYRGTVETSVYVRPDQARRGLGRRLLAELIDAATQGGFRQMVAVIGDSDNAASIGLHAALGFRHVGVLRSVGWKHGTWLDTVLMQRALGPGDAAPPGS